MRAGSRIGLATSVALVVYAATGIIPFACDVRRATSSVSIRPRRTGELLCLAELSVSARFGSQVLGAWRALPGYRADRSILHCREVRKADEPRSRVAELEQKLGSCVQATALRCSLYPRASMADLATCSVGSTATENYPAASTSRQRSFSLRTELRRFSFFGSPSLSTTTSLRCGLSEPYDGSTRCIGAIPSRRDEQEGRYRHAERRPSTRFARAGQFARLFADGWWVISPALAGELLTFSSSSFQGVRGSVAQRRLPSSYSAARRRASRAHFTPWSPSIRCVGSEKITSHSNRLLYSPLQLAVAVLCSLGARSSPHSVRTSCYDSRPLVFLHPLTSLTLSQAIIGAPPLSLDDPSASPTSYLAAGSRRETACLALEKRACDLAWTCNVLQEITWSNLRVLAALAELLAQEELRPTQARFFIRNALGLWEDLRIDVLPGDPNEELARVLGRSLLVSGLSCSLPPALC